jgi:hypothetical protein
MKFKILIAVIIFLFTPLIYAETTFFDSSDEVFIMGNYNIQTAIEAGLTNGETTGAIEGITTSGGCIYKWNCTDWSRCSFTMRQTRECFNIGSCLDDYNTPKIEQNCTSYKIEGRMISWKIINGSKSFIYIIIAVLVMISVAFFLDKSYIKGVFRKIFKQI